MPSESKPLDAADLDTAQLGVEREERLCHCRHSRPRPIHCLFDEESVRARPGRECGHERLADQRSRFHLWDGGYEHACRDCTFPIEWTLTRVECPALWADWVTGTGTGHAIIRIVPSSEGVFQITAVNTASGTAVDSAGLRLQFAYKNAFLMHNIDGPTFQQTVTDSFHLAGPGGKTFRVSVGYVSQFKVDAGGSLVFDKRTARGDVGCQPI